MPKKQKHTYRLQFTVHVKSHPVYSFPAWRCITSFLSWTAENKPKLEKLAKSHLNYLFNSWSDLTIAPVCSCCETGGAV